ncbi:isoprenyl transferase [Candidatus Omnitrophota bacterium]
MIDKKGVPRHIAIIMDGNGRWARSRGRPKLDGHRAGANTVEVVVKACIDFGVQALTLYAFSTENWQRPKKEVSALMKLFGQYIDSQLRRLKKNGIRLMISGDSQMLPLFLHQKMQKAINETKENSRLILNLALNYGSREEIIRAVKAIAHAAQQKKIGPNDINQELFAAHLYTAGLPDPELLIRTSGELRVSNFLLWQISYAELYFTPKFWPDFKKQDLKEAILDFQSRERRFGK